MHVHCRGRMGVEKSGRGEGSGGGGLGGLGGLGAETGKVSGCTER